MDTYRRIVHPTDFSAPSAEALLHAVELAERHSASLTILHVDVVPEIVADIDAVDVIARLRHAHARLLDEVVSEVRTRLPNVTGELLDGITAAGAILDFALEHSVSLLVMGTHGFSIKQRGEMLRGSIGSTTEKVVRLSPCSVMTVRPGIRHRPGVIHRIVVPIDFSPYSRIALGIARNMARSFGATLYVLHVIEPLVRPVFYGRGAVGLQLEGRRLEERAEQEIDRLLKRPEVAVPTRAVVRRGRPDAEIAAFAEEVGAQLIVQGSRGLSGLNYLMLGSVAERVVRTSSCPVLTVKGRRELLRRRHVHRRRRLADDGVSP